MRRHSWAQWSLFLQALVALCLARAALLLAPFALSARWLGLRQEGAAPSGEAASGPGDPASVPGDAASVSGDAASVAWAVRAAAGRLPWQSTCLVQALAGALLLRRRGMPATLVLGVARDPQRGVTAHAWLRCGEHVLTGAHPPGSFQELKRFALKARIT